MENGARAEQVSGIVPCLTPPTHTESQHAKRGLTKPPYKIAGVPRQRNMAQIKEQIKTLENELSDRDIANLSDAEFKTLVTRNAHKTDQACSQNEGTNEGYPK